MTRIAAFSLFDNKTVLAGTSVISNPVSLEQCSGFLALNGTVSETSPDITIEYLTGLGSNVVLKSVVASELSDTEFHMQFYPDLGERIQIKVTNNSVMDCVVSLSLLFTEN
ncbi:MAG: hypothetical protein AB1454_02745 [Candidatus Auribacterota bacterium]